MTSLVVIVSTSTITPGFYSPLLRAKAVKMAPRCTRSLLRVSSWFELVLSKVSACDWKTLVSQSSSQKRPLTCYRIFVSSITSLLHLFKEIFRNIFPLSLSKQHVHEH
jgi:hypothetical protein